MAKYYPEYATRVLSHLVRGPMIYRCRLLRDVIGRVRLPFMGRDRDVGRGVGIFRFRFEDVDPNDDTDHAITQEVREEAAFWGAYQLDADRNDLDLLRRCVLASSLTARCSWASCLTDPRVKYNSELGFSDCAMAVIDNWTGEPLMVCFLDNQNIWLGTSSPLQTARDHIDRYIDGDYYDRFSQFTNCRVALLEGYQNATRLHFNNVVRHTTFLGYANQFKKPTGRTNIRAAVLCLVAQVGELYHSARFQEGAPDYDRTYSPTRVLVAAGWVVWHACRVLTAFGAQIDRTHQWTAQHTEHAQVWFHRDPTGAEQRVHSLIQKCQSEAGLLSFAVGRHYTQKKEFPRHRDPVPECSCDYRRLASMWRFPWEILDLVRAMAPCLGYTWGQMLESNATRMP